MTVQITIMVEEVENDNLDFTSYIVSINENSPDSTEEENMIAEILREYIKSGIDEIKFNTIISGGSINA